MNLNFKKFSDIGNSEPRAWKMTVGTKFVSGGDDYDDGDPVPYCDEFGLTDDESTSDDEDEPEQEQETETETDSVTSVGKPLKRVMQFSHVLQEESDFMPE